MAKQTDLSIRSKMIYQVFPRQHSSKQNFIGVIEDLDRLKDLGVDILYFLPIHPIGKLARKGEVGSPYSIADYYAIDPSLGSLETFETLIAEAHKRNIKVMMDIVFNHTSRDAKLVSLHPDWYVRNEKGELANRIGDWSDIADLNFENKAVWTYLIDVLKYWAKRVDGFRCDVAPLLPLDFWLQARKEVSEVNPDLIWLTESVEYGFIKYLRDSGFDCSSDSEMYQAFDICYDYDIHHFMNQYLDDRTKLTKWLQEIIRQEVIYPKNYIKMRSFENHDQKRLRQRSRNQIHFMQLLAMMFFLKGPALIYGGQEHSVEHAPSLFENDLVPWNQEHSIEPFIKKLSHLKKQKIFIDGIFNLHHDHEVAVFSYQDQQQAFIGIFNLEEKDSVEVPLKDGIYHDVINERKIQVKSGIVQLDQNPIILQTIKDMIK